MLFQIRSHRSSQLLSQAHELVVVLKSPVWECLQPFDFPEQQGLNKDAVTKRLLAVMGVMLRIELHETKVFVVHLIRATA